MMNVDFPTVQWARKMSNLVKNFDTLSPDDLHKLNNFLERLADFRANDGVLTEQQVQVIMQSLRSKELVKLEVNQGGIFVEFSGDGFVYERFLIRADGKMPNNRYEAKKAP
jgi:hypothetical protein